ncbi:hypothetical protein ACTWQL_09270 [Pseudalkalibacillus sp. R45]|uniref:hypothetical protein n=1 Tax=Pseudalkalibacillus sp. R45 TaxID=3457433 RepID=UPI003FCE8D13
MRYKAKTQRVFLVFMLGIAILSISVSNLDLFFYCQMTFIVFLLIALTINYEIEVRKERISYTIQLAKIQIFKKSIFADQVTQIKFQRFGWSKKGTILKVRNWFDIRIVGLEPEYIFKELNRFAEENGTSVSKSKDYLILDRKIVS